MAEFKTKQSDDDISAFLNSVEDENKRANSFRMLEIMAEITGDARKMWCSSIIGFR